MKPQGDQTSDAPWLIEKRKALEFVAMAIERMDKEDFDVGSNLHQVYGDLVEAHAILKARWV